MTDENGDAPTRYTKEQTRHAIEDASAAVDQAREDLRNAFAAGDPADIERAKDARDAKNTALRVVLVEHGLLDDPDTEIVDDPWGVVL